MYYIIVYITLLLYTYITLLYMYNYILYNKIYIYNTHIYICMYNIMGFSENGAPQFHWKIISYWNTLKFHGCSARLRAFSHRLGNSAPWRTVVIEPSNMVKTGRFLYHFNRDLTWFNCLTSKEWTNRLKTGESSSIDCHFTRKMGC
jgi:hypothetical protein